MPLDLRRVRPEEHARVGELTVAAYEPFLGGTEDDYRARLADIATRDREAEIWVAVDGDTVLGNVTVCPPGSAFGEIAEAGEGEFRMLAVDPAARGLGVGGALVDLVLHRFRREGMRGVVLSTLPAMSDAHRLYERRGFTRAPERDWAPVPGVDLLAYTLDLEETP